jgi:chromosome partitioning protein
MKKNLELFDMTTDIDTVIERYGRILNGELMPERTRHFRSYAISNFRGGIGKSTLAFNLGYEISRSKPSLFLDTCSQRNFSQNVFGDQLHDFQRSLYDSLISEITNTTPIPFDDELIGSVRTFCSHFAGGKPSYMIPGSAQLFLFPSLLYSQLAQYNQLDPQYRKEPSARTLLAIRRIADEAAKAKKSEKILIDTSPFFAGATHLSWLAADALIIPVRVDQNSVEALDLTLKMLKEPDWQFHKFNQQAGITHTPRVHAVVMTHCGWNRQKENTPDSSTRYFIQKSLEIAKRYSDLFSEKEVNNCFYLLDDFHSSGRISGKQRIPLSQLRDGQKFNVDGQRLEVNPSIARYQMEIKNLAEAL